MKTKNIANALIAISVCIGLNSCCWFNSAGKICDVASHQAAVCASNAKRVTVDAQGNYYVQMNHIFADYKRNLLLTNDTNIRKGERSIYDKSLQWYRVNPEYGQYLTGIRSDKALITSLKPVSDSTALENSYTKTIVQNHDQVFLYDHTSPNAGWMYLGAVFEFLCVDVPVSATMNAGLLCMFFMAAEEANKKGAYQSGLDIDTSSMQEQQKIHAENERMNAMQTTWYRQMGKMP